MGGFGEGQRAPHNAPNQDPPNFKAGSGSVFGSFFVPSPGVVLHKFQKQLLFPSATVAQNMCFHPFE